MDSKTLASNKHNDAITLANELVKLGRPQNILFSSLLAGITAYVASGSMLVSVLCFVLFITCYNIAAAFNNYKDTQTDKINKNSANPLISNPGLVKYLPRFFAFNLVLILIIQLGLTQPYSAIITLLFLLLSYLYSVKYNVPTLLQTAILAMCYGVLPFAVGAFQGNLNTLTVSIISILIFMLIVPVLLAKDYKDKKGDAAVGKITPVLKFGDKRVRLFAIFFSIAPITLLFYIGVFPVYVTIVISLVYTLYVYMLHLAKGKRNPWLHKAFLIFLLIVIISSFIQAQ